MIKSNISQALTTLTMFSCMAILLIGTNNIQSSQATKPVLDETEEDYMVIFDDFKKQVRQERDQCMEQLDSQLNNPIGIQSHFDLLRRYYPNVAFQYYDLLSDCDPRIHVTLEAIEAMEKKVEAFKIVLITAIAQNEKDKTLCDLVARNAYLSCLLNHTLPLVSNFLNNFKSHQKLLYKDFDERFSNIAGLHNNDPKKLNLIDALDREIYKELCRIENNSIKSYLQRRPLLLSLREGLRKIEGELNFPKNDDNDHIETPANNTPEPTETTIEWTKYISHGLVITTLLIAVTGTILAYRHYQNKPTQQAQRPIARTDAALENQASPTDVTA